MPSYHVPTLLEVPIFTDEPAEAMFFDFLQNLYEQNVISALHCYCMQFQFLLWGYDWVDE